MLRMMSVTVTHRCGTGHPFSRRTPMDPAHPEASRQGLAVDWLEACCAEDDVCHCDSPLRDRAPLQPQNPHGPRTS